MRHEGRAVRRFLYAVIAGNLIVLAGIFILPRLVFMTEHGSIPHAQRLETSGPSDMPNQFADVYRRFLKIRGHIPLSARVFVPPKEGPRGTVRAPMLQMLYPRQVHFADDADFAEQKERALRTGEKIYIVFDAERTAAECGQDPLFRDGRSGWGVCRLAGRADGERAAGF